MKNHTHTVTIKIGGSVPLKGGKPKVARGGRSRPVRRR